MALVQLPLLVVPVLGLAVLSCLSPNSCKTLAVALAVSQPAPQLSLFNREKGELPLLLSCEWYLLHPHMFVYCTCMDFMPDVFLVQYREDRYSQKLDIPLIAAMKVF